MREIPLLLKGPMVCGTLNDTKNMTRRIIDPQPPGEGYQIAMLIESTAREDRKNEGKLHWIKRDGLNIIDNDRRYFKCPYGQFGDHLWVKETFMIDRSDTEGNEPAIYYRADYPGDNETKGWQPSIFMPREASRLILVNDGTRAERLQDISEEDAKAEGIQEGNAWPYLYKPAFSRLWDSIYAKPKPIKIKGKIDHYVSYPWEDICETREYRGKKWFIVGNPYVWAIKYHRLEVV